MTITSIKNQGKGGRVKITCDECQTSIEVPCQYNLFKSINGGESRPDEGGVNKKMVAMGWSVVKGKHTCKTCKADRKAKKMVTKQASQKSAALVDPSKKQKRDIISALGSYYDTEAGRYKGGETDASIAELCEVMPGWVSQLRDDLYGPDGGKEDIEALISKIKALEVDCKIGLSAIQSQGDNLKTTLKRCQDIAANLARIKEAVGPHIAKRAGVK